VEPTISILTNDIAFAEIAANEIYSYAQEIVNSCFAGAFHTLEQDRIDISAQGNLASKTTSGTLWRFDSLSSKA
jgi:hypothetical protein